MNKAIICWLGPFSENLTRQLAIFPYPHLTGLRKSFSSPVIPNTTARSVAGKACYIEI